MILISGNLFCILVVLYCASQLQSKRAELSLEVAHGAGRFCPTLKEFSGMPIDVKCFDTYAGVFHPLMPQEIDAIFYLYRHENNARPYRRFRFDESFEGERDDLFNPDDRLAMVIHGFTDNALRPWMLQMKDALFLQENPEKLKVILVNWHKGSQGLNYPSAARNVMMLARTSAELLYRLVERYNLREKNIHLIGHSLGGHTVGQMATWLYEQHGFKVGRATGLDVASPLFAQRHIIPNKSHAHFFESVHTSSGNSLFRGAWGLPNAFSHLDIYPNGGVVFQPGCYERRAIKHCSHDMSRAFYSQLLTICNKGCAFNVTNCYNASQAHLKMCNGSIVDICSRMKYLAENATDDDAEIVYFETVEDEIVSPCNENWNTTFYKSPSDVVTFIESSINPDVY